MMFRLFTRFLFCCWAAEEDMPPQIVLKNNHINVLIIDSICVSFGIDNGENVWSGKLHRSIPVAGILLSSLFFHRCLEKQSHDSWWFMHLSTFQLLNAEFDGCQSKQLKQQKTLRVRMMLSLTGTWLLRGFLWLSRLSDVQCTWTWVGCNAAACSLKSHPHHHHLRNCSSFQADHTCHMKKGMWDQIKHIWAINCTRKFTYHTAE